MTKKVTVPNLKDLRLKRAWPQDQLAEITNLSVRTIQRVENGGPASFETLKAIASAFETKVEELTKKNKEKSKKSEIEKDTGGFLVRIENGTQLFNLLGNTHAYQFYNDESEHPEDIDLIASFIQELKDWGELWDEIEPGERVVTARQHTDRIVELEKIGFWVFGARTKRKMVDAKGSFYWNVMVLYILKSDNPEIIKIDPSKASVYAETI